MAATPAVLAVTKETAPSHCLQSAQDGEEASSCILIPRNELVAGESFDDDDLIAPLGNNGWCKGANTEILPT